MTYFTVRFNIYFSNLSTFGCSFCVLLMVGCAANTIDEAVPLAVVDTTTASEKVVQSESDQVVVKSAGAEHYPNINNVPSGATTQLSDQQTAATRATLEQESLVQQRQGESPEAYLARLRKLQKLGSTHAAATLQQIEESQ